MPNPEIKVYVKLHSMGLVSDFISFWIWVVELGMSKIRFAKKMPWLWKCLFPSKLPKDVRFEHFIKCHFSLHNHQNQLNLKPSLAGGEMSVSLPRWLLPSICGSQKFWWFERNKQYNTYSWCLFSSTALKKSHLGKLGHGTAVPVSEWQYLRIQSIMCGDWFVSLKLFWAHG